MTVSPETVGESALVILIVASLILAPLLRLSFRSHGRKLARHGNTESFEAPTYGTAVFLVLTSLIVGGGAHLFLGCWSFALDGKSASPWVWLGWLASIPALAAAIWGRLKVNMKTACRLSLLFTVYVVAATGIIVVSVPIVLLLAMHYL